MNASGHRHIRARPSASGGCFLKRGKQWPAGFLIRHHVHLIVIRLLSHGRPTGNDIRAVYPKVI